MLKTKIFIVVLLGLFLLPLSFSSVVSQMPDQPLSEKGTFNPVVVHDTAMDCNNNKIHDHLESVVRNGFPGDMYSVIATFNQPLTKNLISSIHSLGGEVFTSWSVIYGAGIRIRGTQLQSLASLPEINFITENYQSRAFLSTSVPQINVRPYIWTTLGYEGDPTHAIAILDTGIDSTHVDIGGAKVVFWKDFVGHDALTAGDEYLTATDWNGHGTHCSSIAAGTGAAGGVSSTVEITGTLGLPAGVSGQTGYVNHVEVESAGIVQIQVQWDDKDGPNHDNDTLFIAFDSDNNGSFTPGDILVYGDYYSMPLVLTTETLEPGKYLILIGPYESFEIGRASIQYKVTRPASLTSDGKNKYRGVAPNCKLVGLKTLDDSGVGTQGQFLDALDWIYENGTDYGVEIVSMSLGFSAKITAVDTAVNNLVAQGYICVVAAGNGHTDGDYIYSPGTASKGITVGAIDDVDKVAIYSSNGYIGDSKPDVLAPGGAYKYPLGANENTHLIIAADTNNKDIVEFSSGSPSTYWETEMNVNDYTALQGTSMATPHVAGLAALIIQAMGSDWTHTEAAARRVKNYICGTATEVQFGETVDIYSQNPILNRGNRDQVEGFGKVHGDAAIEAFLTTYVAGSVVTDSLSSSPGGKQAWARKVELVGHIEFTAGIEIAGEADYDLYLYDPTADFTSSIGILTSSTNAGNGIPENILYTPANNMTAYLVIKRVSGSGSFTLQAEATKTGTPSRTPFISIPMLFWVILSTLGLSTVFLLAKKIA